MADWIEFTRDGEKCMEWYIHYDNQYKLIVNNLGEFRKTSQGWENKIYKSYYEIY